MSDPKHPLDLSAFASDYQIVGELGRRGAAHHYSATRVDEAGKRRDDDTRVLIAVVTTPEGDEGNALSHLAADTKLLAGKTHRRLIPVIEGRWIGEAFAVVTQRITDSSLAEKLATGERFSTTRTAAILREVNGVIEWAREQGVVHRTVTADGIFLEPKTDRVRVSFSAAPLPRLLNADAGEDARTIAKLAMAMLTGRTDAKEYKERSLVELRPDLPERLGEATAALLGGKTAEAKIDVGSYLALIGMADPLRAGETEAARIRAELLAEQLAEREKLANERAEFERAMADERATFEQTMVEERAKLARETVTERAQHEQVTASERAQLEQAATNERERLAAERAELQRAATEERTQLVATRAELERTVADQLAEMKRVAVRDREQIERLRAEIVTAGELEVENRRQAALNEMGDEASALDGANLATPVFVPIVASPLQELVFDDDSALMRHDDPTPLDLSPPDESLASVPEVTSSRRKWAVPVAIAGSAVLVLVIAVVLGSRTAAVPPVAGPVPKAVVAPAPVAVVPVSVVPLPATPVVTDSSVGGLARPIDSISSAWMDSIRAAAAPVAVRRPRPVVREQVVPEQTPRRDGMSFTDSLFLIPPAPVRRVTPVRRDSVGRPDTTIAPPGRS